MEAHSHGKHPLNGRSFGVYAQAKTGRNVRLPGEDYSCMPWYGNISISSKIPISTYVSTAVLM
ncbi:MAG TPA: hypothetical protein VKG67_02115 [Gallionellaceae bacterium]|nr:hypothetical protein [Gallionellaceae bacterium]